MTRNSAETRNVETVLRLFNEGWGAHAGWQDVWRDVMSPDLRSVFHSHPPIEGREEAIAFNAGLFEGFTELSVTVKEVIAEGDKVVVLGRLVGTHDGPFLGVLPTGKAVDVPDMTLFTLSQGRVVEMRYFTDLLAVMTTIGAVAET